MNGTTMTDERKTSGCRAMLHWWKCTLFVAVMVLPYSNAQDISMCCTKAEGTCRSVCEKPACRAVAAVRRAVTVRRDNHSGPGAFLPDRDADHVVTPRSPAIKQSSVLKHKTRGTQKMSLVVNVDNDFRDDRMTNINRFCPTQLVDFWTCMNNTIEEVVEEVGWWGRACCGLAIAPSCRDACSGAQHEQDLISSGACRQSDEIAFFDCVHSQRAAQWCCSQTHHLNCYEACHKALWKIGSARTDGAATERALDECEQSPLLLRCLRNMTASTVHTDTSKYVPCCYESSRLTCRSACEAVLRRTGEPYEISETLTEACGAPSLHDGLWQCFLTKDEPTDTKDIIPHDIAKLHCCQKAKTTNCKKLCFETFNTGWQNNWQKFYSDCLGDPQENDLTECVEEVESPCSLGCAGLTYCSQLNSRPTTLFRSCTAQADLDAHLAVAEQKNNGFIKVSGLSMPLKNSSQCPTDIWKSVACPLHVKPCTDKGHSSLVCLEDCLRVVAACVQWARAPPRLSAASVCARLAPRDPAAPCVRLAHFMSPSTEPPLLSAREAVTSPCSGAPCNASQACVANRNCLHGGTCKRYICLDGCRLGDGSTFVVPHGSWVRVPMAGPSRKACFKLCRCGVRGLADCQPLPCVELENCRLHDRLVSHGARYWVECNACVCAGGERVCGARACAGAARLPCACPPHHLPARAAARRYPNACLAKCAGATDAEIEFGSHAACGGAGARCGRREACARATNVCLSRLQTSCPQHVCVNTSNCNSQPLSEVCDTDGATHAAPCQLALGGKRLAYWGPCLSYCSQRGTVCGVNGITYISECAAWAEYASVDYLGPCLAVGLITDQMEPMCQFDRIVCPPLKKRGCQGFTSPGACCPKCGGALRVLYSKKQIDRALYGTNISATVINLQNLLKALERHVKIAECALRGYLTIETEIFVSVETLLEDPTDLQLEVCVLEAEKIADMINRESALISVDLGLSALSYALTVHTYAVKGANEVTVSIFTLILTHFSIYVLR